MPDYMCNVLYHIYYLSYRLCRRLSAQLVSNVAVSVFVCSAVNHSTVTVVIGSRVYRRGNVLIIDPSRLSLSTGGSTACFFV
jgi:hypothetical protein